MINGKTVLAIVPARGGSKGIPGKNIKLLGEKPLISWTIEAAKESKSIDKVIVSTDSEEIANLAKDCGAEIPFMRPSELATDTALIVDTILHIQHWFEENDKKYDYFILLQPTSPFRTAMHIDQALDQVFRTSKAQSLVSVKIVDENPYSMRRINSNGFIENFMSDSKQYPRRQDKPKVYIVNGAIYICEWDIYLKDKNFYKRNCLPYIMEEKNSLDLDSLLDWKLAEVLLNT
jgi:CMP-N,N'-diacetyllegionaminic acid synthase